jgi:hypothetical protein
VDAPRTLPELLLAAGDAIDGENLDIDRLETLRRVNQNWLQPQDEARAVDYLLGNLIGLVDQLRMHL